jgi:hypothetical protein
LFNEIVDDGRIYGVGNNIGTEAEAHDTGGTDGMESEAELLLLYTAVANDDSVGEVVALNIAPVEVRDVETTLLDQFEGRAVVRVDWDDTLVSLATTVWSATLLQVLPTLCQAVAELALHGGGGAEVGLDRVDPCIAATGVEEEADILGWRADGKLGVVAATRDVVERLEVDGLAVTVAIVVVALEPGEPAGKGLSRHWHGERGS